jgi:signal transduction histidine kinase/CheY-like chemotaxis protein
MHPITLRFEPDLERAFFDDYTRDSIRFVRVMLALSIGVTLAFAHWDHLLFPDVQGQLLWLRAGVISPTIALVLASTFSPRLLPYWQLGVSVALTAALSGLVAMLPILPFASAQTHVFPGMQLVLMFAFAAFKLRFVYALAVSLAGVALYLFIAAGPMQFPAPALVNAAYFLGWSLASGALTAYLLERFSRRDFLRRSENARLTKRIEAEREAALEANASKTRFLAAASHDLRQPMHTVGLLVDILRDQLPPGESRRLAERVHSAAGAMEFLLDGLLDLSRLDGGQLIVRREIVSLSAILRSLAVRFEPLAERKGLKLTIEPTAARVETDPVLAERMLGNLLDNAIKYTDRGSVTLRATPSERFVRIDVSDTGCGIPTALSERIFEEFYQVGNSERDRSKGLGIGLAIVRRTAALLDHPTSVASEVGRGSTFSIDLPRSSVGALRADDRSEQARVLAPLASGDAAGEIDLRGLFVLVIDDEAEVREAMQSALESWGCPVLSTASGAEALVRLGDHLRSPDLIVCDYRLREGENGLDVVARLREALGESVPALLLTGDLLTTEIDRIRASGLDLVRKPLHGPALRERIARATGRTPPPRER